MIIRKGTKLKAVVAALVATGAALASTQAHAYVYASSRAYVSNLLISVTGLTNDAAPTYSFSTTNTATLNGSSAIDSDSCSGTLGGTTTCGTSPVLNSLPANATGGTVNRADNSFAYMGPNGTDSFANADSVITTAQLVNLVVPTATQQIAETLLNTDGQARANAEITSNTNLNWVLSLTAGTLVLDFDANPQLRAAISEVSGGFFDTQANINASFTLTRTGQTGNAALWQVSWAPDGGIASGDCYVGANLTGVTCAEDNDDYSMNANASSGVNPSDENFRWNSAVFGNYGITVNGLQAGTYSLALNLNTSAIITRLVPEPGTLALLGMGAFGLVGFANTRRRRSGKAA